MDQSIKSIWPRAGECQGRGWNAIRLSLRRQLGWGEWAPCLTWPKYRSNSSTARPSVLQHPCPDWPEDGGSRVDITDHSGNCKTWSGRKGGKCSWETRFAAPSDRARKQTYASYKTRLLESHALAFPFLFSLCSVSAIPLLGVPKRTETRLCWGKTYIT